MYFVLEALLYTTGRGVARAEDAQGTPTQSHVSPSILYGDKTHLDIDGHVFCTRGPALKLCTRGPALKRRAQI